MRAGGHPAWIAVLLAVATLLLGEGYGPGIGMGVLALLFLPLGRLLTRGWVPLHVLALLLSAGLALTGHYRDALGALVGWLLVHRRWTGATAGDSRVALLFATLLALLGCLQEETMGLGLLLVAFVGVLPAALLRAEAGEVPGLALRGVAAGLLVVALGAALYLVLPRLRGGYFAQGGGTGGVGATVTLGDDQGASSDQLVARFRVVDADGRPRGGPHYLQGRVLDQFDGRVWRATLRGAEPAAADAGPSDHLALVELEPQPGGVIFGPPEMLAVAGLGADPWRDGDGGWHHRRGMTRLGYEVRSRMGPATEPPRLSPTQRRAFLQLPELDPEVLRLAWSVEPDTSDPRRIAAALSELLSTRYLYVEAPPPPEGDPLRWFLFEARSGHCEYFASALAVLLRARDVPSRLATGFYTAELGDDAGEYVARASHAHAWVEVPLPSGWTRFDPSPLDGGGLASRPWWERWSLRAQDQWVRLVVDFDLGDQFSGLDALGTRFADWTGRPAPTLPARTGANVLFGALGLLYGLAVLAQLFAGRLLVRAPHAARGALAREVEQARKLCARRGWALPPGLPILSAAAWLEGQVGAPAAPLHALALLAYQARYAPAGAGPDARAAAARCLRALRALPRAPPLVGPPSRT